MPTFKENKSPAMKRSAYKMKGMDFGNSPLADKGEVVSKTSPGLGWTKTKGTNIWAPPVADKQMLGRKKGRLMKDSIKKVTRPSKKSTITDETEMKPPYARPTGPRA
jgi:hypothetical protein